MTQHSISLVPAVLPGALVVRVSAFVRLGDGDVVVLARACRKEKCCGCCGVGCDGLGVVVDATASSTGFDGDVKDNVANSSCRLDVGACSYILAAAALVWDRNKQSSTDRLVTWTVTTGRRVDDAVDFARSVVGTVVAAAVALRLGVVVLLMVLESSTRFNSKTAAADMRMAAISLPSLLFSSSIPILLLLSHSLSTSWSPILFRSTTKRRTASPDAILN